LLLVYVHAWVQTCSLGLKRVAILHGYRSDAMCVTIA
jgi:hypothetical protein